MKWPQFSLRSILLLTALVATIIAWRVIPTRIIENDRRLLPYRSFDAKGNSTTAVASYWAMRARIDHARGRIADDEYQGMRREIDDAWVAINPGLDIPEVEPPKQETPRMLRPHHRFYQQADADQ